MELVAPVQASEPTKWANQKYLWEPLSNGKPHKFIAGVHFEDSPQAMQSVRASAQWAAKSRRMRARTTKVGRDLVVQFLPKDKSNV